ncbi:uncharacterized protein [Apostichopus japonicus]|uniref:uncharacterized protein n=1 Tax=Stichopus japonicus TaxID=307972 RepID=UPI003AB48491
MLSHLESVNQRVELSFIMMAARFVWTFNLMYCLRGEKGYPIFQTQETNRYQGFLLQEIIPNACLAVIAVIFQMWNTSVSSFMNKAFQLASNHFYSTLGIITPVFILFYQVSMCLHSGRAKLCSLIGGKEESMGY